MLKIAKAIGANTDFLTAQAFTFSREELSHLIVLVSGQGEDVFTKVRQRAFEVEEQFFSNEDDVGVRLEKAYSLFKNLEGVQDLMVLVSFINENILYLEGDPVHRVFLNRDEKTQQLVATGKMVSGYIQSGDKLLFITSKVDSEIYEASQLNKFFKVGLSELEDEVEEMLHNKSSEGQPDPIAVILVENQLEKGIELPPSAPKLSLKLPSFYLPKKLLFKKKSVFVIPVFFIAIALLGYSAITFLMGDKASPVPSVSPIEQDQRTINQVDWPVFLSIDLIRDGFSTSRLSYSLGKILLLDDKDKTLVVIDTAQKTPVILAGATQLGKAVLASLNGDNAFIYSEDKGLLNVNVQSKKVTSVTKTDPAWGRVVDIFGFASNVYVLDEATTSGKIWKYAPIISGYSEKIAYLKGNVNFSDAKRMVIDYSVWVTKPTEILKFTGGANDGFSVSGLTKKIVEVNGISVPEDGDNMYILDSFNSRIIVVSKKGEYKAQYVGERFKGATDFAVDTQNKKIYLLEGGKIYQLEVKETQ